MNTKNVILILLSVLFYQCKNKDTEIVISLKNSDSSITQYFLLNSYGDTVNTSKIQGDKTFQFELKHSKEDYFSLNFKDTSNNSFSYPLYLKPKEYLTILVDSTEVDFIGDGSKRNEYLFHSSSKEKNWYELWVPYYGKITRNLFFRDSIYNSNKIELSEFSNDPLFFERELSELDYAYANFVLAWVKSDSLFEKDVEWVHSLPIDNKIHLNESKNYLDLVSRIIVQAIDFSEESIENTLKEIKHEKLRQYFISRLIGTVSGYGTLGLNENGMIIKDFSEKSDLYRTLPGLSGKIFKEKVKVWQNWENAVGKKAAFSYEDINGKIVNLRDFEGKYVYIDFWATWCGWCIKEFPKLFELKDDFKDKNIEFISISIDFADKKDHWKKMVTDRNFGGIQLISPLKNGKKLVDEDKIEDPFLKLLDFRNMIGLPVFCLIGPDGRILDASALRPSNSNINDYLDTYLKQN